jgi:thioredoxin-dependent peroxiredoxin
MSEAKNIVTMHGNPMTLAGNPLKLGAPLPDAMLVDNNMKPVRISDYRGKVVILSVVPSLDTPVCDMQTRRFNTEATSLGDDVVVLTVSMDLPFAQKRWCGAAGVKNVTTLSDYRKAEFGQAAGLLINELRLLARAVLVLDRQGVVRYHQLVEEVSTEPNYETVISAVKEVL